MKFDILNEDSGAFSCSAAELAAAASLAELVANCGSKRISKKRFIGLLERYINDTPELFEPYDLLASLYTMDGKPERALKLARKGIALGRALIPSGFAGRIAWQCEENRPYLGLVRTAVTCLSGMRRHAEAAELASSLLALDPDDGACVRFTAGHEHFRAGDEERARQLFRGHAHEYPPFCYELGLSLFNERELVGAATAFRRGIAANPYIALVLFTGQAPNAFPVAHIHWWEGPEAAVKYLGAYGGVWDEAAEAQRFLYWLFNNSRVMVERAAIMACKEGRPFEEIPGADAAALEREAALIAAIDDTLSTAIVRQRDTPVGPLWPWDTYQGAKPDHTLH
jgi:tetratricopeptide (TPR) repeat protein